MNAFDLQISIKAIDKASATLNQLEKNSGKVSANMKKHFKETAETLNKIGASSLIAGGAITAGLGVAVKNAADFSKQMSNVSTLIDTNVENMEKMNQEVLDMSTEIPVSIGDLSSALYDVRSAGINAASSMNVLRNSAKLGVAGLGSTKESVDIVTSSINAFGLTGRKADKVYDNIFKTVKYGKTNISELSQGFGATAGTVAAAGIELDEYLASVAALTTTGQPASQAHTQIKAAIAGLTRETKESKAVFNQLGATSFKDLIQKSGGMVNAFDKVTKTLKGNDAAILKVFGSTEAFNAVMSLTGKQGGAFRSTLNDMRGGLNAIDVAYDKQSKQLHSQIEIANNSIQTLSIAFGTELAPSITAAVKTLSSVVKSFSAIPAPIKSVLAHVGLISGVSLIAFGTMAGMVSNIMNLAISCGVNFTGLFAKASMLGKGILAASRAFLLFNASLLANPITWWVVGITLAIGATIWLVKNWDNVTATFNKAFNAAKNFFGLFGGKKDVNVNATVRGSGVPNAESAGPMPKYDVGSTMITKTGKAIIHKGEKIIPANTRIGGNTTSITFSPQVTINGNSGNVQQEVERALEKSFSKMMFRFQTNNARLAY